MLSSVLQIGHVRLVANQRLRHLSWKLKRGSVKRCEARTDNSGLPVAAVLAQGPQLSGPEMGEADAALSHRRTKKR